MNITIITYEDNPQGHNAVSGLNAISHRCSLASFHQDAIKTIRDFVKSNQDQGKLDIFWHLGKEFDVRYGHDAWQVLSLDGLLKEAGARKDEN